MVIISQKYKREKKNILDFLYQKNSCKSLEKKLKFLYKYTVYQMQSNTPILSLKKEKQAPPPVMVFTAVSMT